MEGDMKVRKLNDGDTIEVGDSLLHEHNLTGKKWFKVVRVTPKLAMVGWNECSEGKFKRTVTGYMKPLGYKDPYSQTSYSFWRPVTEEVVATEKGNVV